MKDAALHLEVYAPAAGATVIINPMDIGIDQPGFSNQWRLGRLRVAWPAMPNLTSNADNLTITLQDSADNGATFQSGGGATTGTIPQVAVIITGVAANGVAAGFADIAIPPGTRGPLGLSVAATANAGNNTAALLTADWLNE
jgi:hypothetical protein